MLAKKLGLALGAVVVSMSSTATMADHHGNAAAASAENRTPYVRADVQAYLDRLAANPRPTLTRDIIAMIRKMPPEMMVNPDDLPLGELAVVKDVIMPGPGGELKLRMYDPRETREAGPVVVFFHGGAFTVGSIVTHEGLTAEMARQLDLPVISVEYRLAPENPFPAAVDDSEAAARWIAENGAAFGRDFDSLIVSGDSAGGNLTLVTTLALRDMPAALPVVMQIPIYPVTEGIDGDTQSRKMFARGYGLDFSKDDEDLYQADPKNPRASPYLADLAGVPPTVMITAGLDPLRDEGRDFAAKLIEAGVQTVYYEAAGNIHGFAIYRKAIPSAQKDVETFLGLAEAMLEEVASPDAD